jgi:hypothetical protein
MERKVQGEINMYIKINNGTIYTKDTPIADEDAFVGKLVDALTDVIEEFGCEWCVGFCYGDEIQKEYGEDDHHC